MPKCVVRPAELVGYCRADANFNQFKATRKDVTQIAVYAAQVNDVLKGNVPVEQAQTIAIRRSHEPQAVSRETVVVNVGEELGSKRLVADYQVTRLQDGNLRRDVRPMLRERYALNG